MPSWSVIEILTSAWKKIARVSACDCFACHDYPAPEPIALDSLAQMLVMRGIKKDHPDARVKLGAKERQRFQ